MLSSSSGSLGFLSRCGGCGGRVHRDGREHLRGSVGKEHGVHWGAVELVEIEASHFCVAIYVDLVFLEGFGLVVTGVGCGTAGAGIGL